MSSITIYPGSPAAINIVAQQGRTLTFELVWANDGTPCDVTGYTALMQVRTKAAGDAVLTLASGGSGIVVGTTDGKFTVTATAAQMNFVVQSYVYQFVIFTPSTALPTNLAAGAFTVQPVVAVSV